MSNANQLAKEVWETLSSLNVNEHTEKKGNLTYLSWAWAWSTLMEHYPNSIYDFDSPNFFDDGSCEVWCTVTISKGEESISRRMFLAVMDNRNNAVKNPDARQISDTRMRALVKCLAMLGLGHYIYAGEDLPTAQTYTDKQKAFFDEMVKAKSSLGLYAISQAYDEDVLMALFNSFPKGKISALKKEVRELEVVGGECAQAIREALGRDDNAVAELIEDEPPKAIAAFSHLLNEDERHILAEINKRLREAA